MNSYHTEQADAIMDGLCDALGQKRREELRRRIAGPIAESLQLREMLDRADQQITDMTMRTARLASLLTRCLPVIDGQPSPASTAKEHKAKALAVEIREAFGAGDISDDIEAVHAFAVHSDEVAAALQNLLNGIRSDLVTVDAIADETWANALQQADNALKAYHKHTGVRP